MLRKSFFVGALILLMTMFHGCMPVTKPFVPAKVEADKALVYVYRLDSFPERGTQWSLRVNNKVVSTYFINNGYIPLHVDTGNIEIGLYIDNFGFPSNKYDSLTINNVKAGDIYYVKAIPRFAGLSTLELIDNSIGEKEISSTLYFVDQMK